MLSLLPSVNFESFEPVLDQPFPSESARVIFASDGAHLCALLCMVRAYIQGWTENPRTRQLDRNGDIARRVDRGKRATVCRAVRSVPRRSLSWFKMRALTSDDKQRWSPAERQPMFKGTWRSLSQPQLTQRRVQSLHTMRPCLNRTSFTPWELLSSP